MVPASPPSSVSNDDAMLTIHHLQYSQSERIVWLCEELRALIPDFTYDVIIHNRDPQTARAPRTLRAIHPAGTAPIIVDHSVSPRVVLAESQAIVEYIIHTHGKGFFSVRPGEPNYVDYLYWYNFANGSFQALLTRLGSINLVIKGWKRMQKAKSSTEIDGLEGEKDLDQIAAAFGSRLSQHFEMIDERLDKATYLAGERLTAADIMTVFSLTTMRGFFPVDLTQYGNILRYLQEVAQRLAYRRAMERAESGLKLMIEAEVAPFDFTALK